ncbi:MAG: hypothetical protein HYU24_11295, partial [Candidatus Rokubacteria bacterium]|nr:hypothetical protein [Candidatus Rokubacteria bacterium]
MDLTYEDVQNILMIIESSSLEELHLEIGDFKLIVRKKGAGSPAGGAPASPTEMVSEVSRPASSLPVWPEGGPELVVVQAATEAAGARKEGAVRPRRQRGHEVKAPMVGIFYR